MTLRSFLTVLSALLAFLSVGHYASAGEGEGEHGEVCNVVTRGNRPGWGSVEKVDPDWDFVEARTESGDRQRVTFATGAGDSQAVESIRTPQFYWNLKEHTEYLNRWQATAPAGWRVFVKVKGKMTITSEPTAPIAGSGGAGAGGGSTPTAAEWETNSIDIDLDSDADGNGMIDGSREEDLKEDVGPGALVAVESFGPLMLRQVLPTGRPQGVVTIERSGLGIVDVGRKNADGTWQQSIFANAEATTSADLWSAVDNRDLGLLVKGIAAGQVVLTARYWNDDMYLLFEDRVVVTVLDKTKDLQIVPAVDHILPGQKVRFWAYRRQGETFANVAITWKLTAPQGQAVMIPDDNQRHEFVDVEGKRPGSGMDDVAIVVPRNGAAQAEETFAVLGFTFIADNNADVPATGDGARLRISKVVTDRLTNASPASSFPLAAVSFDGPPTGDPDVFRAQIRGVPAGYAAKLQVQLAVLGSSGSPRSTHTYGVTEDTASGQPVYRIDEQVRLVSNEADDAVNGAGGRNATLLAELGDRVQASLILEGKTTGARIELPVNRPSSESGPDAIRIVDMIVHPVAPLQAAQLDTATLRQWLNQDWAQAGVRFRILAVTAPEQPVSNVFLLDGQATAAGDLGVRVDGKEYKVGVNAGDDARTAAVKLVRAMGSFAYVLNHKPVLEQAQAILQHLVVINRGAAQSPALGITARVPGLRITIPDVSRDLYNDLSLMELQCLGYNFRSADDLGSTVEVFAVDCIRIKGSDRISGMAVIERASFEDPRELESAHNSIFLSSMRFPATKSAELNNHIPGHECGHVLLNVGDTGHVPDAYSLMHYPLTPEPGVGVTKRLSETQQQDIRTSRIVPVLKKQ